jgi:hypothetical protein
VFRLFRVKKKKKKKKKKKNLLQELCTERARRVGAPWVVRRGRPLGSPNTGSHFAQVWVRQGQDDRRLGWCARCTVGGR